MAQEGLLGLTLWRPWPNLIAAGIKTVENRKWHPRRKGGLQPGDWFAVHSGKHFDAEVITFAHEKRGVSLDLFDRVPESVITCIARYDGHTDDPATLTPEQRNWWLGPIAWILGDVFAFEPIPCQGKQGLWPVPPEVVDEIRERWRAARGSAAPAVGAGAR